MLTTHKIGMNLAGDDLFSEVSLSLDSKYPKRVALVGRNGCGKSTLLRILAQELAPTEGTIELVHETVGYLPQELDLSGYDFVGEFLESKIAEPWEEYKIETALRDVGLGVEYMYASAATLSGGEKVKIGLAALLISEPTILLLDEPTNNIDIEGINWLINFVREFAGAVLFISHDRYMINAVADYIWEFQDEAGLHVYEGNYDAFLAEKERVFAALLADYNALNREIVRLKKWLTANEFHPKYRFSAYVMGQKKKLDRLEAIQTDKPKTTPINRMKDLQAEHRGLVVQVDVQQKAFGDNIVFQDLAFTIHRGERVLLQGPNGAGKSTLLKIILGQDTDYKGEITLNDDTRIGYLSQTSTLDPKNSILREFEKQTSTIEPESRSMLHQYGFDRDMVVAPIASLSYGQLKRLDLAIMLAQQPNLIVLDEPTNHLDIYTREDLEGFILKQDIPMIIVSHDTYFVNKLDIDTVITLGIGR